MSDPFANLVTRSQPRQRLGIPGRPFDPVRIGFLVDFWMPDVYLQKMYVEPILLAFEEAVAEGHSIRPLELVVERAFALPQSRWENALHGLRRLREAGCVGVIGPLVSDNARTLREAVNHEIQLPCVTWAGTSDWQGEYCFRLGNGGCTEEGVLMASWLAHRGITPDRRDERDLAQRPGVLPRLPAGGGGARPRDPRRRDHHADADGPRAAPRQPARRRRRGPRLHGLRLSDLADAADLRAPGLGSAADHDHGLPVLLREPGLDEGARRLGRDRSGLRAESALRALPREVREALGVPAPPSEHRARARLRLGAGLHRSDPPRRRRADRLGREGRPRAHALLAELHRRAAHPHRRRAGRPQSLPRRLAALPARRRRERPGLHRLRRHLRAEPPGARPMADTAFEYDPYSYEIDLDPVSALPAHARRGARLLQPAPRFLGASPASRIATTPSSTGRPTRRRRAPCSS